MSVYGGDSWGREANYRKRRVDDLLVDQIHKNSSSTNNNNNTNGSSSSSSSYKKLPNGKYACLVCPHNPVVDTPLMLSIHMKGSRHCAAESRLKEKELYRQAQLNKRIALSGNTASADTTDVPRQQYGLTSKPLTQRTMKAVSEALRTNSAQQFAIPRIDTVKDIGNPVMKGSSSIYDNAIGQVVADKRLPQQQLDYKERKEKELKFTAAGWKRDGFGGWYKDESVEFDSDEEDPNVSLA
ncbi:uncharacterized protein LOC108197194 [Daucus carota subsp. sativus]|uniref:uncharacterized protein LOC108197194 n=1 Tax=Daucus carota subsp. sativus TaxID=79200 RepID=UPI003082CA61